MSHKKKDDAGWMLPAVIDPPGRICTCIPVPDEPNHRQAFWGALLELGYQFNWQRDPGHNAVPVSVLWYQIVAAAQEKFYSGERTMCFSCEELQECLQPMLDALKMNIVYQIQMTEYGTDYPPSLPLPPEAREENLAAGTNPTCNFDILWAQCWQAVVYADAIITDALELAESATNDVELVDVITSLPVLDEMGADVISGYIENFLEGIQDNYFAQVTEAYLQESACAIFCLAQDDCSINLDRVYKVYYDRVTDRFGTPIEAITTMADLFFYLADQDIDGTIIADVMNMIIWGGGILSNQFLGDVGTTRFETLLKLAVNDANNDWEILCIDCPVECESFDFRVSSYDPTWQIRPNFTLEPMAVYTPGVGYEPLEQSLGGFQCQIFTISSIYCNTLEVVYTCAGTPTQAQVAFCNEDFSVYLVAANLTLATGTVTDTVDMSALTPPPGATGIALISGNDFALVDVVTWQQANFS